MDVAVAGGGAGSAYSVWVELLHPDVDGLFCLGCGQCAVGGGCAGQGGVDQVECIAVGDELGAPGDGGNYSRRDITVGKDGSDLWEAFAQCLGDAHLGGGGAAGQVAGGADRSSGGFPTVDGAHGRYVVFVVAVTGHDFGDGGQAPGGFDGFCAGVVFEGVDQCGVRVFTERRPI